MAFITLSGRIRARGSRSAIICAGDHRAVPRVVPRVAVAVDEVPAEHVVDVAVGVGAVEAVQRLAHLVEDPLPRGSDGWK